MRGDSGVTLSGLLEVVVFEFRRQTIDEGLQSGQSPLVLVCRLRSTSGEILIQSGSVRTCYVVETGSLGQRRKKCDADADRPGVGPARQDNST
jgi:hypothetical protein